MSAVVSWVVVGDDDDDRGSDDRADENDLAEEWVLVDRGSTWSSEPRLVMFVECATVCLHPSSLG